MPAARAVQVDQPHIHKVRGALVLKRVWHGLAGCKKRVTRRSCCRRHDGLEGKQGAGRRAGCTAPATAASHSGYFTPISRAQARAGNRQGGAQIIAHVDAGRRHAAGAWLRTAAPGRPPPPAAPAPLPAIAPSAPSMARRGRARAASGGGGGAGGGACCTNRALASEQRRLPELSEFQAELGAAVRPPNTRLDGVGAGSVALVRAASFGSF